MRANKGLTIGRLAERNAGKRPDEKAIIIRRDGARDGVVTFQEFNHRVDKVANNLAEQGIGKDDKVATYMSNNIATLETYLATMKLGALPVPVNHLFQPEEIRYVLTNSDSRLLVFDNPGRENVSEIHEGSQLPVQTYLYVGQTPPSYADSYSKFRAQGSSSTVEVVPSTLDDAALMYTSGTTGQPKGCILTHNNLIQHTENSLIAGRGSSDAPDDPTALIITPLFHIAALGLFLINFYTGATTVLMDGFDPENVLQTIDDEQVTGAFLVPTIGRELLAFDRFDDYDISSIETISIGAAPSGQDLKKRIGEAFNCELGDAFGQTETSPTTCVLQPDEADERPDSVGQPMVNVETKVVDEDGTTAAPGEIGRIAYRGPTVFQGYYKMPEKTDEVFDEDGWFISDDLVRQDAEDYVYFVGRADDMIISGGENIHPAEIEDILHAHDKIAEAAIVGVPDETWGERVKAVVVLEERDALIEDDIIAHVKSQLAGYKQPREVEFVESLPRNPTGKVLKEELA